MDIHILRIQSKDRIQHISTNHANTDKSYAEHVRDEGYGALSQAPDHSGQRWQDAKLCWERCSSRHNFCTSTTKKALFQIMFHKYFFAFVDKKRIFHRLGCWTQISFQYHHRCMWTVIQIYRNLYFAHWVWINNLDRNIRIPHFSAQLCSIRSPSTGMCVIYMEI